MLNVKNSAPSTATPTVATLHHQTHGVVEVEHISKTYGDTKALKDVSFSVSPGEVVGILGPNGAGKTTLLEILEGLKKADEGSVSIFGKQPGKGYRSGKDNVGVVMQHTALPPSLKVVELLDLYRSIYAVEFDMKQFVIDTGLEDKVFNRVKDLSGGQKQRSVHCPGNFRQLAPVVSGRAYFRARPTSSSYGVETS